jgi:hypothetical protein
MTIIGKNTETGRQVGLLFLPQMTTSSLPKMPEPYFGVFLACDAKSTSDDIVLAFGQALLRQGLAYVCVWGPDCERVHDLFDEVIVENNPHETEQSVRITTWLADETLDEAVWHFLNVCFPADDYYDRCHTEVFIVIANKQWATDIEARIADQEGLDSEVVGE